LVASIPVIFIHNSAFSSLFIGSSYKTPQARPDCVCGAGIGDSPRFDSKLDPMGSLRQLLNAEKNWWDLLDRHYFASSDVVGLRSRLEKWRSVPAYNMPTEIRVSPQILRSLPSDFPHLSARRAAIPSRRQRSAPSR
jgi:hypothetical protein